MKPKSENEICVRLKKSPSEGLRHTPLSQSRAAAFCCVTSLLASPFLPRAYILAVAAGSAPFHLCLHVSVTETIIILHMHPHTISSYNFLSFPFKATLLFVNSETFSQNVSKKSTPPGGNFNSKETSARNVFSANCEDAVSAPRRFSTRVAYTLYKLKIFRKRQSTLTSGLTRVHICLVS